MLGRIFRFFFRKQLEARQASLQKKLDLLEQRTVCFSQEGEDLILDTYLHDVQRGFYVDVGCYHPVKYSNTYLFYLKGWRGINIDARPGSMALFNKVRPHDTNLEVAIGNEEQTLTYYMFDEPALNGFSSEISLDRHSHTPYKIKDTVKLPMVKLRTVLATHLPAGQPISFMSIDVEGLDLNVLQSNDWSRFRPYMVLVETSLTGGLDFQSPIHKFLEKENYNLVAKTYRTSFYKSVTK